MVVDDYSKKPRDKTTVESSKRLTYRPRLIQRSMSPRPGGRKADQEMNSGESSAECFNGKERKKVALK